MILHERYENLLYISVGQYCLWNHTLYCINFRCHRVAVIVWLLDLQLPMHSVYITTDVVNSNLDQGEVYNIMWYSLSVTFDRSVVFSGSSDFLNQWNWPPRYNWNIVEMGVKHHNPSPKIILILMSHYLTGMKIYLTLQ